MEDKTFDIRQDSKNARCYGLLGRVALTEKNLKKVHADDVKKIDGPFICPSCLSEAIVRKCSEKVNHFAHKARLSPILTKKDQSLHEKCKHEIFEYLKTTYPDGNWEKERPIPKNEKKETNEVIPDISGRINGNPIAIEIQKTAYTINKIFNKTETYYKWGIYVLWIVPLKKELGVDFFRPRLFEKYLHSIYYGRVYYYVANGDKKILPVHYSPTKRWIEESIWFDTEEKIERHEGGFYLTYKTVKTPNYGEYLDITKDFKTTSNNGFSPKNVKKRVPKCFIYQDKLAKWWSDNEYKEISKQSEVTKQSKIFNSYEYFDDYDDEFYP